MPEMFTAEKRSEIMSKINSKNTSIEIKIRKIVYHLGYRYSLHSKKLAGKPDLSITRLKKAIFINGCFWHGHPECPLFVMPQSKMEYWSPKIEININRDAYNFRFLINDWWKIIVIWECVMRGRRKLTLEELKNKIDIAIKGENNFIELTGK